MKLRTVLIDRDGQAVRINETAFDPERHTLWEGEAPAPDAKGDTSRAEIEHKGGGWYVVTKAGEVISGDEKVRKAEAESIAEEANGGG